MEEKLHVLMLEDITTDAELAIRELKTVLNNFIVQVVDTEENYLQMLKTFKPELIISDYQMPTFDGLSALNIRNEKLPSIPFVILTGSMNEATAVQCLKAGADDYVIKEHIKRLGPAVLSAIKKKKLERDHQEAVEALYIERDNLKNIFESLQDGIYIVNKDYDIQYVNPVLVKTFGSPEGKKCYKYFHDLDVPCTFCKNKDVFAGKTVQWEWTSPINGKTYDLVDTPMKNVDGSISKLEIFHDITERKEAEKEIRKLSSAVTQSPSIITITDINGNLEYVNPKFSEVTGYSSKEAVGQNPRILKSGELSEEIYRDLWATISSGKEWRGEFHNKKKNGELFWEAASISPIFDKQHKIISFLKVSEDITFRKITEEALKASEEKLRLMIDNSSIGFSATDLNGNFIEVNPAICNMIDYTSKEMMHKHFNQFSHPDDWLPNSDLHEKLLQNKIQHFDLEKRYIHKNGSIVNVLIRSQIVRDDNGKALFEMAITEDITLRKQAEEHIKLDLEVKTALLKEIYHRTKNNMQVISSMLTLQSRFSDNVLVQNTFKDIINKIKAMSMVHEQLYQVKDLSKINLKIYIKDVISSLKNSYQQQAENVSLNFDLQDTFVLIDSAVPLGLVLNELITNVFKHAFPNNRKGEITIRLYKEKDGLINIHLSDNGISIPTDYNIRNAKTLGIPTVFSLIEYQLNGELDFKVEEGLAWHIKFKDDQHKERI